MLTGHSHVWKTTVFFSAANPSAGSTWSKNNTTNFNTIPAIAFAASDATCNTYAFGSDAGNILITSTGGTSSPAIPPGTVTVSGSAGSPALAVGPNEATTLSRVDQRSRGP